MTLALNLDEKLAIDRLDGWAQTANECSLRGHPYEKVFKSYDVKSGRIVEQCLNCQAYFERIAQDPEREFYQKMWKSIMKFKK